MKLLRTIADLLFPRRCAMCGSRLAAGESGVCGVCTFELPYTNFRGRPANPVERMFWGKFPVGRATAYMFYHRDADSRNVIFSLKYYGQREVGVEMGRRIAVELSTTDFFATIDLLVPVPLSRRRIRRRGYNQSLMLAQGIEQVTHIPICDGALRRIVDNPTQTQRTRQERLDNVCGIFRVSDASRIRGKHILLVDDVITTGATLTACADELTAAGAERISVIALAVTKNSEKI